MSSLNSSILKRYFSVTMTKLLDFACCSQMATSGVCVRYAVDDTKPTGICCFCFVDGVRSSVTHTGASTQLVLEHLSSPGTRDLMDRAVCLFIECYQLGCCFDVLYDVATYALNNDRSVFSAF